MPSNDPLIPDGYIFLARQVQGSNVWSKKPAWWFKVWCHILIKVNHKANKQFKRGEAFFSRTQIYNDCCLANERNVQRSSIDGPVRWLRRTSRITTQQTTRGMIIRVLNYNKYQHAPNYRYDATNDAQNDTRNDTRNDARTTHRRTYKQE